MRDKVYGAVDVARPYVDRIAPAASVRSDSAPAHASARTIYDELLGSRGAQALATRVAQDKDMQSELRNAVEELRRAGERAQGKSSHSKRNFTLLLAGITLGVLFNPATGPETRKWLKEKVLGPEQPFEYRPNEN